MRAKSTLFRYNIVCFSHSPNAETIVLCKAIFNPLLYVDYYNLFFSLFSLCFRSF